MNISEMFKTQGDYPFGFEVIKTSDIPITTIYIWRYLLIIHPSMYLLLEEYIGEDAECFEDNLNNDVESSINTDVSVINVSNLHYSHVNNPTIVELLTTFVKNKQKDIQMHVELV